MLRLNPYAAVLKRAAILTAQKSQREKDLLLAEKRGVSYNYHLICYIFLELCSDIEEVQNIMTVCLRNFDLSINFVY